MKLKLSGIFILLLLAVGSVQAQEAFSGVMDVIAVDSSALKGADTIRTGQTMRIFLTFDNNSGVYQIVGSSNAFRVYSPDGATWTNTTIDTFPRAGVAVLGKTQYDGGVLLGSYSVNGQGYDTVTFSGFSIFSDGVLPNTRLDSAVVITIGQIPAGIAQGNHGKHLCIDSAFNFPPTNEWAWSDVNDGTLSIRPSWAGPYCWVIWDEQTLVRDNGNALPTSFALNQNYPNPFNPKTEIKFDIPEKSRVTLTVYNVLGQEVRTLIDEELTAGTYRHEWDGRDDHGKQVTTGVYFYKLQAGSWTETKKMTFLK